MKSRPLPFIFLSMIFLLIVFGLYWQVAYYREASLWEIGANLHMWSPMNWVCALTLVINAFLSFHVFGLLKYTLPAQVLIIAYNNYLSSTHGVAYTHSQTTPATLAFIAVVGLCLYKAEAWTLLQRPNLRWWATAPRFERNLPVVVHTRSIKNMRAKTFDVSMTGAFLCSLDDTWNVKQDEELIVTIEALGFECRARVVRITFGKGNYPEGVGIRFEKLSDHARNLLKYFISGRPENLLNIGQPDPFNPQGGKGNKRGRPV